MANQVKSPQYQKHKTPSGKPMKERDELLRRQGTNRKNKVDTDGIENDDEEAARSTPANKIMRSN